MSDNRICEVSLLVSCMKNLKILRIDNNLIKVIPDEIIENLQLEKLSIFNNLLVKIPENIDTLKECLEYLDVSKNHVYSINEHLFECRKLKVLKINSNCFTTLPLSMVRLNGILTELYLDWIQLLDESIELSLADEVLKAFFQSLELLQNGDRMTFDLYDLFNQPILIETLSNKYQKLRNLSP